MTKITYNGKTTELADGYIATLPCKDKQMATDVVVEAPEPAEISDSPLPIEVSTEAEMTALLTSGEVGGVYKYTGTTGTYENGALYVLENVTITFTIAGTTYQAEEGMTWYEWCHSNYNTYGYSTLNESGAYVTKNIGNSDEYVCKSASGGFSNCVVGNGTIDANATYYHYVQGGGAGD